MKTTRTFASICLSASCIALVAAANVSVGDQPGVFQMSSAPQAGTPGVVQNGIDPVPDPNASGNAAGQVNLNGEEAGQVNLNGSNAPIVSPNQFLQNGGVTGSLVNPGAFQTTPLQGPQFTFDQTLDDSLGMQDSYTRINAFIPNHLLADTTILAIDLSASLSADGDGLQNYGVVFRHYDETRNRIFGLNLYGDFDDTAALSDYSRVGFGIESLGNYLDFVLNGYVTTGGDTQLSSRTALTGLSLSGNNVVRQFSERRENAYEGFDWKIGTPVPWLGRRGLKAWLGSYYLNSEYGSQEALGLSAQFQLQATDSLEVNAFYTNDEVFGSNSWVNVAYTIPQFGPKQILRPKTVRRRLYDPVRRTPTIHTKIEETVVTTAEVNPKTGMPWFIYYVDPNATTMGTGSLDDPFMTLQAAVDANDASVDAIRITPRVDETGTNLTLTDSLDLFDEQSVFSAHKDFTLFSEAGSDFVIAADVESDFGPMIQRPGIMAGEAVINVGDWNRVAGLYIDASNATGTVNGIGVNAPAPFDSVQLQCNTFVNYTIGANLLEGSGELLFDENTFTGTEGISTTGLMLTTAAGSSSDLRMSANTATNNSVAGLYVRAGDGATIDAEDLLGLASGTVTGVVDNVTTNNANGIVLAGGTGSTLNVAAERNTATDNTANGFFAEVDGVGASFNLSSLRGNTFNMNGENGAFLHYLNGADFTSVSEDLNGDGVLSALEDLNGNGVLDQGIVSNDMSHNVIAGLCIFGEGDPAVDDSGTGGAGLFDIGGPEATLGNTFTGNLGAGIAVDLQDSATYQADTLFNLINAEQIAAANPPAVTVVLDFWEASQGALTDVFGNEVTPFDVTDFGFAATDFDLVTTTILEQVRDHFYNIPTVSEDTRSPLADGQQLAIDFVIGDIGTAPSNGATEFYYSVIGGSVADLGGVLGIGILDGIRNAGGTGPNSGVANADQVQATYSTEFAGIPGLDTGNLTFTRNALAGTVSHEVGHTLSLMHLNVNGAVTPTGASPIMNTGAIDATLDDIIGPTEFAYSGQNDEAGGATQMHVQQLIGALGTRSALQSGASGDGITVVATDRAVIEPSTFLNNTIENLGGTGLSVQVNESARAEGITIQSNLIQNNMGRGVNLEANGPMAFIEASNTIGGAGMNTLAGVMFAQGNTITGNQSDGLRVLASDGGVIYGNLINNSITENAGNGVALLIDGGGTVDFGTVASNRIITGNDISGNVGFGLLLESTVDETVSNTDQEMTVTVQGNTFTQNMSGGLVATLNGVNNIPPGPPALGFDMNNVLNLSIGSGVATETNVFDQNEGVGIGVVVTGTGLANVDIIGNTITNTTAGTDPIFDGDGINLIRRDSSLLLANVLHNTVTGNAANGLEVDTQGTNKENQNQPMVGTVNSVEWNNNVLNNNGGNGASFATRGDSQLFANGMANVMMNNTLSGVLVTTSENSSFGDPTLVGDARRTVFNGIIATNNGLDGVGLFSSGNSQLLLEITSSRIATTSGAHAALNTMGDTLISDNGRDGVHIETSGTAMPDILITSETPVTPTSAITLISGNGTNNTRTIAADTEIATAIPFQLTEDLIVNLGGNGIFWDAYESARGTVRVYNTSIIGNLAGDSEDLNGDGILTFQEDLFGNYARNLWLLGQDTSTMNDDLPVYTEGNLDIDVLGGDGIQYNYYQSATSTLIVGDVGMGNLIQENEDDGIALTGDIRRVTLEPDALNQLVRSGPGPEGINTQPTVLITGNTIGGQRDGVAAGNGGDGVSVRSFGFTADGVMPGNVDNNLDDGDGFDPSGENFPATVDGGGASDLAGNNTSGPIPIITLANNTISRNNRIGVNIRLNGGAGIVNLRDTGIAPVPSFYTQITLTENTIASNGEEGVFLRADSDMNQNRIVFTQNLPDADDNFVINTFSPTGVDLQSTFAPNDVDATLPFLNLATVQNTLFTATGNIIQNNGTNTVNGEGIEIRVGTGSYVAADIRDNIMGGNLEADLVTGSFHSAMDFTNDDDGWRENTFDSVDVDGEFLYDIVYLDDAALLDMRFTGNDGDQIDPMENEAFELFPQPFLGASPAQTQAVDIASIYTNADAMIKGTLRSAGVFKIDDYFGLNAPVNNFVELGTTQIIGGAPGSAFSTYTLQSGSAAVPFPTVPFHVPAP